MTDVQQHNKLELEVKDFEKVQVKNLMWATAHVDREIEYTNFVTGGWGNDEFQFTTVELRKWRSTNEGVSHPTRRNL